MFWEIEPSSPKIKKLPILSQKKFFLYFRKLDFLEKLLKFRKETFQARRNFLYFWK